MTDGGGRPGNERPEELRVLRPAFVVLGEGSLVPETNLVRPPPDRLTHELATDEPYRLDRSGPEEGAAGVLPAGTPVAVHREGDDRCRVVTASGLAVDVRRTSLRELPGDGSVTHG